MHRSRALETSHPVPAVDARAASRRVSEPYWRRLTPRLLAGSIPAAVQAVHWRRRPR